MRFLSKAEVLASLPTKIHKPSASEELMGTPQKHMKQLQGPYVEALTPEIAKEAVTKTVYGLLGQTQEFPESMTQKKKEITQFKVLGFITQGTQEKDETEWQYAYESAMDEEIPDEEVTDDDGSHLLGIQENDGVPFQAYRGVESDEGLYVTGSGSDRIQVFVDLESKTKSPKTKSAKKSPKPAKKSAKKPAKKLPAKKSAKKPAKKSPAKKSAAKKSATKKSAKKPAKKSLPKKKTQSKTKKPASKKIGPKSKGRCPNGSRRTPPKTGVCKKNK